MIVFTAFKALSSGPSVAMRLLSDIALIEVRDLLVVKSLPQGLISSGIGRVVIALWLGHSADFLLLLSICRAASALNVG